MTFKSQRRYSVALPASLVSDTPHLREKTAKIGLIARACSIFGVSEIVLYRDDLERDQADDLRLCQEILGFIETPQYLRKHIFGLRPSLKFAGILPPLQIPSHNVPSSLGQSRVGDFRDGVVLAKHGDTLVVDVGLNHTLECPGDLPVGARITIQLTEVDKKLQGRLLSNSRTATESAVPGYWGFKTAVAKSTLGKIAQSGEFNVTIGTSRYGTPIERVWAGLAASLISAKSVLLAFGSPKFGLKDVLRQEHTAPEKAFTYFINTMGGQEVSTVRTEEAVLSTLAILNLAQNLR